MSEKTHWKENFNYEYLGAYSLKEGQEVVLTIKNVKKQIVKSTNGQKEDCTVAYFEEAVNGENKPMILNKTNCKIIEKVHKTGYIQDWKGKRITIYVEQNIKAFGDLVDALRIRKVEPKGKIQLTPEHAKWNDAIEYYKKNKNLIGILKHYEISPEDQIILTS